MTCTYDFKQKENECRLYVSPCMLMMSLTDLAIFMSLTHVHSLSSSAYLSGSTKLQTELDAIDELDGIELVEHVVSVLKPALNGGYQVSHKPDYSDGQAV